MNRKWCLAALLMILPGTAASAATTYSEAVAPLASTKGERLVSPALPEFVVASSDDKPGKWQQVEIPADETVGNWTTMVTTQWFRKLANHYTPAEYAGEMVKLLPANCPKAAMSPLENLTAAGGDAVRFRVVCNEGADGQTESFVMLIVAGKDDMYVKQVAFKRRATAEDFLWARKFLNGVRLCEANSAASACTHSTLMIPAATTEGERLLSPQLPNFFVAHSEMGVRKWEQVEIRHGETAQNWRWMITTQWFKELADTYTAQQYAGEVRKVLGQTCPQATVSSIDAAPTSGERAVQFKVACPTANSGQPENFVMLIAAGQHDMYIKQVAFRGKPSSKDFGEAEEFLEDVHLCEPYSTASGCTS